MQVLLQYLFGKQSPAFFNLYVHFGRIGLILPSFQGKGPTWILVLFRRVSKIFEKRLLASSCLSVCPSVHMEQLCYHWKDFHEILYFTIFQKPVEKIQFSSKSDKTNRYFTWRPTYRYDRIPLSFPHNDRYFRQQLYRISKHTFYVQ